MDAYFMPDKRRGLISCTENRPIELIWLISLCKFPGPDIDRLRILLLYHILGEFFRNLVCAPEDTFGFEKLTRIETYINTSSEYGLIPK